MILSVLDIARNMPFSFGFLSDSWEFFFQISAKNVAIVSVCVQCAAGVTIRILMM